MQYQLAATVGFDCFGIQVHRHVLTSNIAFGLVLVVLIKQYAITGKQNNNGGNSCVIWELNNVLAS